MKNLRNLSLAELDYCDRCNRAVEVVVRNGVDRCAECGRPMYIQEDSRKAS